MAVEHAASEAVQRRLAHFYAAAGRETERASVIVGLPPSGLHEIGAFAFAVAGRRAGLDLLYLGANVPVESWVWTVSNTHALVAVIGVVMRADLVQGSNVVQALGALESPPACLLGGPMAGHAEAPSGSTWLPDRLDNAVAAVVQLLKNE